MNHPPSAAPPDPHPELPASPARAAGAAAGPIGPGDEPDDAAAAEGGDEGDMISLSVLPPGNPLRARGGAVAVLGTLFALVFMGLDRQLRFGVPLGLLGVLVATAGVLDLIGSFDDPDPRVAARTSLAALGAPLLGLGLAALLTFGVLTLAAAGRLPVWASAAAVPAAWLGVVAAAYRVGVVLGPYAYDEQGQRRPLHRRHGFWVVAAAILLFMPMAGNHSLTDPWETHYGEVSREMLSRDDWISTWWAGDGWFFSKPVLNFWLQALTMAALGVKYAPDQMLAAASAGPTPRPEWAVRMPVTLLSILALYLLYKGMARVFGRRAGLLSSLVLMTMPQWAFLTHQTMADMPFVAALSSSMGLFLLGIHTDPDEEARVYEVDALGARLRLSAFHVVFGVILVSSLPQIFYLASRNLELVTSSGAPHHGFRWHGDTFWSGSRGNCGLPGNEACVQQRPAIPWMQPGLQGLAWSVVLGLLLYLNWGERRAQRLCYLAAFYFAAVSTLGKGPAGILLPVLCVLAYVGVTGRWRELTRVELLSGALIVVAVALPWYVAMYGRHGPAFVDRLIFHDMWKRALTHVHDTNEGDDTSFRFYLWQLGYAFFPWTGLVPVGLVWWARRPDDEGSGRGDASVFLAMWFVFAFALFTWMLTKFHHYIFPAVPPAAMLTGVLLDRMLGRAPAGPGRAPLPGPLALGGGAVLVALGVFAALPGSLNGYRGDAGELHPRSLAAAVACLLAGLGLAAYGALPSLRAPPADEPGPLDEQPATAPAPELGAPGDRYSPYREGLSRAAPVSALGLAHENLLLGAAAIAGAVLVAVVGRDLVLKPEGDTPGDARFLHLFTYNYKRAWPDALDFTGVLSAVSIVAALLLLLAAARRLRPAATCMLIGLSLGFAAWCMDVYFVKTAPHWGQRETAEAYYKNRQGPEEPLVAYQMNWKGENFYTGNHIPAFVASGEKFKTWVKEQRDLGVRTFFFTTEHGRVASLKSELGNPTNLEVLTDRRVNNKFTLVRVRFPD